jgi:hypothetical protein
MAHHSAALVLISPAGCVAVVLIASLGAFRAFVCAGRVAERTPAGRPARLLAALRFHVDALV